MIIHLVCYADDKFSIYQKRLINEAQANGVDKIHAFTFNDLKNTPFYKKNSHILSQKKGGGYWIWQTYFIKKILLQLGEDDVLFYVDSGLQISGNLKDLLKKLKIEDVQFFIYDRYTEKQYTKRDCFILMDCDNEIYWNQKHLVGGFHIWKNSTNSRRFIEHIFLYSLDERLSTDLDNVMEFPNFEGFIDHRHLQSIMSLLTRKLNIPVNNVSLLENYIIFKGDILYLYINQEKNKSSFKNKLKKLFFR